MKDQTAPPRPPTAENITAEMTRLEMTVDYVARQIEVSERLVRRWRDPNKPVIPTWPNLCALAELFDRNPGWFYAHHQDDDDVPSPAGIAA